MSRVLLGGWFACLLLASCKGETPPRGAWLEVRGTGTDTLHFRAEAGTYPPGMHSRARTAQEA